MTEASARRFAYLTSVLALVSILAAVVVAIRWRREHDFFARSLATACDNTRP